MSLYHGQSGHLLLQQISIYPLCGGKIVLSQKPKGKPYVGTGLKTGMTSKSEPSFGGLCQILEWIERKISQLRRELPLAQCLGAGSEAKRPSMDFGSGAAMQQVSTYHQAVPPTSRPSLLFPGSM